MERLNSKRYFNIYKLKQMEQKKISIENMLQAMEQELGERPETMLHISKLNKDLVYEHAANKNFAMMSEAIPMKYKLLMSLAISAALGVENCIETYTKVALRKGITTDELMEAIKLARFVKGTTVISSSTNAMKMIVNNNK